MEENSRWLEVCLSCLQTTCSKAATLSFDLQFCFEQLGFSSNGVSSCVMHLEVCYWTFSHDFCIRTGSSSVLWNDRVWNYVAEQTSRRHTVVFPAVLLHRPGLNQGSLVFLRRPPGMFSFPLTTAEYHSPNLLPKNKDDPRPALFPGMLTVHPYQPSFLDCKWLPSICIIKSQCDPASPPCPSAYELLE